METLLKWGSLALFILLCGCAPSVTRSWGPISYWYTESGDRFTGPRYEIRIDTDFTLAERREIVKAIADWNYTLNGQIIFDVVGFIKVGELKTNENLPVRGYWIIKTDNQNETIKALDKDFKKNKIHTIAYTNKIGGQLMYFDMDRIGIRELRGVVLHEMGHALGARHDETGVMRSVITPSDYLCLDRAAVKQVVDYFHLDWDKVNWCYFGQNILPDGKMVK